MPALTAMPAPPCLVAMVAPRCQRSFLTPLREAAKRPLSLYRSSPLTTFTPRRCQSPWFLVLRGANAFPTFSALKARCPSMPSPLKPRPSFPPDLIRLRCHCKWSSMANPRPRSKSVYTHTNKFLNLRHRMHHRRSEESRPSKMTTCPNQSSALQDLRLAPETHSKTYIRTVKVVRHRSHPIYRVFPL